jgi:hypothetical protein
VLAATDPAQPEVSPASPQLELAIDEPPAGRKTGAE